MSASRVFPAVYFFALLGAYAAACTQPFDPSLIESTGGSGGAPDGAAGADGADGAGDEDGSLDAAEDTGSDACQGCWDLGCQPGNTAAACGTAGAQCTTCQSPAPVCYQGGCVGEKIAASVAAGGETACLLTVGGELHCWGSNYHGHTLAAPGSTVEKATLVTALKDVAQIAINPNNNYPHSCARTKTGVLHCYGDNEFGQLGAGAVPAGPDPRQVAGTWLEVAAGFRGTCAIDDQQHVWCWGRLSVESNVPQLIAGSGQWRGLSAANERACAIKITEGDALYCWGTGLPMGAVAGVGWKQVDVGHSHACGIRADEKLYCWGENANGQLGLEPASGSKPGPTQIGTAQWRSVSAGTSHTCGIQADKSLWCWGANDYGELGVGNDAPAVGPQKIAAPSTTWEAVAAGHEFNCAIDSARVVHCWGKNNFAQLTLPPFDPPELHVPTPIQYAN